MKSRKMILTRIHPMNWGGRHLSRNPPSPAPFAGVPFRPRTRPPRVPRRSGSILSPCHTQQQSCERDVTADACVPIGAPARFSFVCDGAGTISPSRAHSEAVRSARRLQEQGYCDYPAGCTARKSRSRRSMSAAIRSRSAFPVASAMRLPMRLSRTDPTLPSGGEYSPVSTISVRLSAAIRKLKSPCRSGNSGLPADQ